MVWCIQGRIMLGAVPFVRTRSEDHLLLLLSVTNILISTDTFIKTLALASSQNF